MGLQNKITEINNSNVFGKIIEMGCGVAISHLFLGTEGASKTISEIKVPYSKESQEDLYGKQSDVRSVSKEFIFNVLEVEMKKNRANENFVMAASFQMQGENDERTLTHGYIGINANDSIRIYHVSIPTHLSRYEYLEMIGKLGLIFYMTLQQIKKQLHHHILTKFGFHQKKNKRSHLIYMLRLITFAGPRELAIIS